MIYYYCVYLWYFVNAAWSREQLQHTNFLDVNLLVFTRMMLADLQWYFDMDTHAPLCGTSVLSKHTTKVAIYSHEVPPSSSRGPTDSSLLSVRAELTSERILTPRHHLHTISMQGQDRREHQSRMLSKSCTDGLYQCIGRNEITLRPEA